MKRRRLTLVLLATIAVAMFAIAFDAPKLFYFVRAYSPFPLNYVHRLRMLDFWEIDKKTGLNCSGFICNAHSSPFRSSWEFYENTRNELDLVETAVDFRHISETDLLPGDIAAFEGPADAWAHSGHHGNHVAAYLGAGVWIDADARRGDVRRFAMLDHGQRIANAPGKTVDHFFEGHVRVYRWKKAPTFSLTAAARTIGKSDVLLKHFELIGVTHSNVLAATETGRRDAIASRGTTDREGSRSTL